ncbi:ABC transporter ATP-binding protein [Kiloniella laminariae]|uniref:Spermidine/putrescine import ATP-binding protein PotA n=1 Tax=Kiloniella laminariae TaxID=454162 RepID=A0ABT4LNB0_9PROT|nr:ABC transporter ATP-binding protein [Kiloniella laminariae]MCZ4282573.1 ABC transporter ATP-binding protein [Kiloniella laminariae]
MSSVSLRNIVKRFAGLTAVHPMFLDIPEGSFVTLLGPSGCGKTTTLRMIAGLLDPTEGEISIGEQLVNNIPMHKRNLGIVFQNYALFPHKTIYDNVAFGLKYRNVSNAEIKRRVEDVLELVQLPDVGRRYPNQLSGGQQQRIALARAIVIKPDVLLLDEPLSALDANLRENMRIELKRIQEKTGITTVFVTHDQSEALAMSDKLVVMSEGRIEQIGAPKDVYDNPESTFVADFLGTSNILDVLCENADETDARINAGHLGSVSLPREKARDVVAGMVAKLVIRAEKLCLVAADTPLDNRVSVEGVVETVDYQGQAVRYFVRAGNQQLQALNMIENQPFNAGDAVSVRFKAQDCVALKGEG